jgi:predicted acetyltransferase
MAIEIRTIRPDELDEFKRVASNALVMSPESFIAMQPEFTLCAFEDGRLATAFASWPLTMRYNGIGIPVGGVTTVGTFPVYRRRGHLRRIMTTYFEQLYEKGERPIAILYASMAAIYQRYGYAIVSTQCRYNVEPRYLQFAVHKPVIGSFRELGDDEFPVLVDLYRRFREERTGYLHRGRPMWDANVLAPPPAGHFLHRVVYEENGEPLGYVIYTLRPGTGPLPSGQTLTLPSGQTLFLRDLIWLTVPAYQAVWEYFTSMDLVASIVWSMVPVDDPLPHLMLEPRMLHRTSGDGLLGRIVAVEKALPQRPYDEEGILTFEIKDDLCSWNQGRWKLEASTDGSSISRTSDDPQVTMPVSTLAMLVFGQLSASEAARMGRLDVGDPGALSIWDRVMRTKYRPACADSF